MAGHKLQCLDLNFFLLKHRVNDTLGLYMYDIFIINRYNILSKILHCNIIFLFGSISG